MTKMADTIPTYRLLSAPFGELLAVVADGKLLALRFETEGEAFEIDPSWSDTAKAVDRELLDRVERELDEYYTGRRRDFDLPLDPEGTDFQHRVWDELIRIEWGETISYGELAARIGKPTASRAVGAANGKNPIPIVIPCHRVIGSAGKLTGFGGGLPIKEALLGIEGHQRSFGFS
ncbi:MAG: methylated-DNA-[protein]-cysteine S-methyltransferase [Planctomycetota bacterium]|jgi:methylated-DNA-[protein]-cysteine S-methyltransferase